jgi:hypothetical protein
VENPVRGARWISSIDRIKSRTYVLFKVEIDEDDGDVSVQ